MMLNKLVIKYGNIFCAIAAMVAPAVSKGCFCKFYQPEEPECLKKLLDK